MKLGPKCWDSKLKILLTGFYPGNGIKNKAGGI